MTDTQTEHDAADQEVLDARAALLEADKRLTLALRRQRLAHQAVVDEHE